MNKLTKAFLTVVCCSSIAIASDIYLTDNTKLPDLKMKDTGLSFKDIEGYQNYKIVATHFRKDKNEIRYILANPLAYNALRLEKEKLPDGSKIVKIGWTVNDMSTFPAALEADEIQRVEYMIRDSGKHKESDGWGYARYVKKNGRYSAWGGNPKDCVSCHAVAQKSDAVFTKFQKLY